MIKLSTIVNFFTLKFSSNNLIMKVSFKLNTHPIILKIFVHILEVVNREEAIFL